MDGQSTTSAPAVVVLPTSATTSCLHLDFEPKFSTLRKIAPVSLEWKKLTYIVNPDTKKERHLIQGVSGNANHGSLVAILGGSGAGKTTLLNILAGRITGRRRGRKLTGELKANGVLVTNPPAFRARVAFVTQEDALFPTSTALEALQFSARLRLPSNVTAKDRDALVEDIIDSLGLQKVKHTLIGSEMIRGLSGGEKKRVAIGVEIVSAPAILFLDEPTSGLDSYSAWKVVRILRALSSGRALEAEGAKCTILCSIHQPSSEVFHEFSHVILLKDGHVVFQGQIKDIKPVFASHGMSAPEYSNIADHIIIMTQTQSLSDLPNDDNNTRAPEPVMIDVEAAVFPHQNETMMNKFSSLMRKNKNHDDGGGGHQAGYGIQSLMLAQREVRGLVRNRVGLAGRFGTTIFLNLLFAIIFMHAGVQTRPTYTAQSHFGAITEIFIGALFGASQPALLTFPLEKLTFLRERATNTYHTTPYMLSKLLIEFPLNYLLATIIILLTYWSIGLNGHFFFLVTAIWLLQEASVSTALLIGSVVSNTKAALELAPIALVPQILFLGFFIQISQLPYWLQWVQWIVAAKFGINLALIAEFNLNDCISKKICEEWAYFKQANNVHDDWAWVYALILVGLFAVFRVISLIVLSKRANDFES